MHTKALDRDGGVVSAQRAREFAEVLTPRWVVDKMLDEIPDVSDPHKTVFDPGCGRGAFIVAALERKLLRAANADERLWACRSCYGIDIQYDNVQTTRERCAQLAALFGVPYFDALFVFTRNIIHGDFLFFPQIARIYDWTADVWTTLADMMPEGSDNDTGKKGRAGV